MDADQTVVTDREGFRDVTEGAPPNARIPVEIRTTVNDPFEAYRRARDGDGDGGCYLETAGGQSGWGYFGVDPIERLEVGGDAVTRDGSGSASLAALPGVVESETLRLGGCDVPFPCGAIGWLSYDVARELESLPGSAVDDRGLPRLQLAVFDRLIA